MTIKTTYCIYLIYNLNFVRLLNNLLYMCYLYEYTHSSFKSKVEVRSTESSKNFVNSDSI